MNFTRSFFVESCMNESGNLSFEPSDNAFTFYINGKNKLGEDVSGIMNFAVTGELKSLNISYCDFSQGIDEEYFQEQIDAHISEIKEKNAGNYNEVTDYRYSVEYEEVYGKVYAIVNFTFITTEYKFAEVICFG